MSCSRFMGALAVAVSAVAAQAEYEDYRQVAVSDTFRTFFNTNYAFAAATTDMTQYPLATVGKPMFWIDCSDTNGWTFTPAGAVTKIPNKGTAEDRYLTGSTSTDDIRYAQFGSYNLWYGKTYNRPTLAEAEGGLKGRYLDFGAEQSKKALFFNKVTIDDVEYNRLDGIGTIIGVYKSFHGSGQILGGPDFVRSTTGKGTNFVDSLFKYWNNAHMNATIGLGSDSRVFCGLQQQCTQLAHWSGDWEVVAVKPKTAVFQSYGLCANCTSCDDSKSTGGQGIAELMIFDRVLTDVETTAIIVYLQHKWLGRDERGYNGNASLSWMEIGGTPPGPGNWDGNRPQPGKDTPVVAGAGETLTIGRLNGGRASSRPRLVKTGAGALRLGDAANYGGEVTVNEGTLAMGKRPIPTYDALPLTGLTLHIDPSDADSITMTDGKVESIASSTAGSRMKWSDYVVTQADAARRPLLAENVPSEGLSMLDFGTEISETGAYMRFTRAGANASLRYGTLIAVTDQRTAIGSSIGSRFLSSANDFTRTSTWVASDWKLFNATDKYYFSDHISNLKPSAYGCAWLNGLPVDKDKETYEAPGFNIVALRNVTTENENFLLGARSASKAGGIRLGEVFVWMRPLTEQEILDVQAYLAKKWLRRVNPGYADAERSVADLQYVVGGAGAKIEVPDGGTATVAHLSGTGVFEKTGAGTLKVGSFDASLATNLVVKEGAVVADGGADVASNCEIAAEPSLHFDPSNAGLVTTYAQGGTNFIWRIEDERGLIASGDNLPASDFTRTPWLNDAADALCNGLPVIDFGRFVPSWNKTGKRMSLSKNLLNVRAVYYILGSQTTVGNPLGHGKADDCQLDAKLNTGFRLDFTHENAGSVEDMAKRPLFFNSCDAVKKGTLYVDGVETGVTSFMPDGGYQLIEIHTTAGCQLNFFGNAFDLYSTGGGRMGEIVAFERELTERERVATRNYLLKKWRNVADADLAPLPAKPALAKPAFSPGSLVADFANPQGADYTGNVIGVRAGMEIELRNVPGSLASGDEVTLFTADAVVGRENFRSVVPVAGSLPTGFRIRLVEQNGVLKAKFLGTGTVLVVR